MLKKLKLTLAAVLLSLSGAVQAVPIVVDWTANGGASAFNDDTILFPAFSANQLLSITDISGSNAIYHDHGGSTTVNLDILLDGIWTNLFTDTTPAGNVTVDITTLGSFMFSNGMVSGLRWTSNPNINVTYHFFDGAQFTFDSTDVPEPPVWALALLGLAGLTVRRRCS